MSSFCAYPDDEYSQFSEEEYILNDLERPDEKDYPITLYKEDYPITPLEEDDLAPKGISKRPIRIPLPPPGLSLSKSVFFKAPTNRTLEEKNETLSKGDSIKGDVSKRKSWYDSDDDPESDMAVEEITKLYNWNVPQVQAVQETPEFPTLGKVIAPRPRREKIPAFSRGSFTRVSTREFLTPKTPENTPMPSPIEDPSRQEDSERDIEGGRPKKNKVCKNWEAGECKRQDCVFLHYYPPCLYGDRCKNPHCKFTHSVKAAPEQKKFKTKICWHWKKHGVCKIDNCCFIHDLNDPAIKYCLFGDNCENEQCRFFHVPEDMRSPLCGPIKTTEEKPISRFIETPKEKPVSPPQKKASAKNAVKIPKEPRKKHVKNTNENMFSILAESN